MDREQIRSLYDDSYASSYNDKFIHSELAQPESNYEEQLLRSLLKPGMQWLDIACGTGYFLSRFPDIVREGLDLSPSMLKHARKANPGVIFHEGSFLDPYPDWVNQWDVISCMWYAYGLVDTLDQISCLIGNLASWTTQTGTCFLPLADPKLLAGVKLPSRAEYPMADSHIRVSAIVWSFVEENGNKVHQNQIAPSVDWMVHQFSQYFESVQLQTYPQPKRGRSKGASWAWRGAEQSRCALVATCKRRTMQCQPN
jgi:SAM-dependent methyltransferase